MKYKKIIMLPLVFFFMMKASGRVIQTEYLWKEIISPPKILYAGVRSSIYGMEPFPGPEKWQSVMGRMSSYFEGSLPCALWIVGTVEKRTVCRLEFPSGSGDYQNIAFFDYDKHEPYLDYFDKSGVRVFLQVEPGNADVSTLVDIVLNRYRHHECVLGFGIDVEWYREAENPKRGAKVKDDEAKAWEARVKSHRKNYRLFLKHWDRNWMPPNYRGDIVFVDDSQIFEKFDEMLDEFVDYWAEYFEPNMVFFQIGYPSDKPWWQKMNNPPKEMGRAIAQRVSQRCGIFWVDLTLRDVFIFEN